MMQSLLLVGAGGAAGSMLRFILQKYLNTNFPYGTLLVNFMGCLLIGILLGMITKNHLNEQGRLILVTGFCGGFTTFSAFTAEANQMMMEHKPVLFFAYLLISVTVGLAATFIGFKLFH